MRVRLVAHTPVGVFYAVTNTLDDEEFEKSCELITTFAERGNYVKFEDANGNLVVLPKGTIQQSVFVMEIIE